MPKPDATPTRSTGTKSTTRSAAKPRTPAAKPAEAPPSPGFYIDTAPVKPKS